MIDPLLLKKKKPLMWSYGSLTHCTLVKLICEPVCNLYSFLQHYILERHPWPFWIISSLHKVILLGFSLQGQGMISFIHLSKNANAAEIGGYADAILDACCQNIASDDEIWHYVVEMSVLLVALIQKSNPHSSWYWFYMAVLCPCSYSIKGFFRLLKRRQINLSFKHP